MTEESTASQPVAGLDNGPDPYRPTNPAAEAAAKAIENAYRIRGQYGPDPFKDMAAHAAQVLGSLGMLKPVSRVTSETEDIRTVVQAVGNIAHTTQELLPEYGGSGGMIAIPEAKFYSLVWAVAARIVRDMSKPEPPTQVETETKP